MSEKFLHLGISPVLEQSLEKIGIVEPTPIQAKAIPEALEGKHVIGQSATGTGKTLAYLLPMLQNIEAAKSDVQAVVLAPTYELAMQIYRQLEIVLKNTELMIRCTSLIGGANIARQIDKLKSKPQIIVGSAGRIIELQKKGKIKLQNVKTLVLDEADRLLDDQNLPSTRTILSSVATDCQHLLFSATISPRTIRRTDFMKNPVFMNLKEDVIAKPNIEHLYFIADFRDKIEVLRKLTRILNVNRGLVFVNRSDDIAITTEKLKFHGLKVSGLNGSANKLERKKALDDFSKGRIQLLVASDVAARGLDIQDIDFVINLDLPEDEKVYLHRVGRTGRAGKSGSAISLVSPKEVIKLGEYAKKIKVDLQPKKMLHGEIADFLTKPKPKNRKNPFRKTDAADGSPMKKKDRV
ncbi:DEAD/DEAH box helicase [Anaerosinus massiliensis]|uniref:DEAD/DEAH box helicase n=1 Tax=Massilibacillus massiliensis TaxID=1806837 RepID=UPI000A4B2833|nr:DEAD/DEAH box helicase [Massilibacillus massiliensis]